MSKKQKSAALSILVLILLIAWFIPPRSPFRLTGTDRWAVTGGILVLGISGLAIWMLMASRKAASQQPGAAGGVQGGPADRIDALALESDRRLAGSGLGKGAKLSAMPAILVLGDTGSAKTSTVMHSGLEPELLAGQSLLEGVVAPTQGVNFWLARNNIFADLSGAACLDPAARTTLIKRLAPATSMMGKNEPAPRAAVVCVDCESFIRHGGAEATVNSARALREALGDISAGWGINLPVYVLFTKLDRIPFFLDYVNTLTNDEAGMVFGSTLSMQGAAQGGVYAEKEAARLTDSFQSLIYGLADKRPEYLARENDAVRLPPAYQFPREVRKLRTLIVQYLVELGRPSQLRTNAFLRGFYFTGVRPVIVSDVAASRPRPEQQPLLTDATGIFRPGQSAPDPGQQATGRKVPQWVFLSHLFPDVVLRDGAALGSSSASLKTDSSRRLLFLGAGALSLFLLIFWLISFLNNRDLAASTQAAAKAIPNTAVQEGQIAGIDSLEKLEALRANLEVLHQHQVDGAPWFTWRWGLYTGDSLYPAASKVYFHHFRRLLLSQTQASLLQLISNPESQSLGYRPVYDALKAYLITTSHPDKSTKEFLPPVLMEHWLKGRALDPRHVELARKQFAFYADVLPPGNPYPSLVKPNDAAVATARRYLAKFAGEETIYAAMLAAASQRFASINFNQAYPRSGDAVRNNYTVAGAFSKGGWDFMKNAIANPDQFFSGEKWVMGDVVTPVNVDRAKLQASLKTRYRDDFLKQWRTYLQSTTVVPFGLQDAPAKLGKLTDIVSPLLGVLCLCSINTVVDDKEVADIFQPAQHVTPAGCQDKLSAASNASYMEKLTMLKAAIQAVVSAPSNDALKTEAISSATNASTASTIVGQQFRIDKEGQTHALVKKILDDPILYAQRAIGDIGVAPINGAGANLCAQWRSLMAKYPFNLRATQEASLAEVGALLAPKTGELAKLNAIVAKLPDGIVLTPQFQDFYRRANAVSETLYKGGGDSPNMTFALRPQKTDGIQSITLNIHGQRLQSSGGGTPMQFTWPSNGPQQVQLGVKIAGGSDLNYPSYSGLWALFRFFGDSERSTAAQASEFSLEWTLRTSGGVVTVPATGKPVTVRFDLDMLGGPPILRPGYMASLVCVPNVVRAAR